MLSLSEPQASKARPDSNNPFPGPKPYRQEDREFFFGRQEEIDELTSLVLSTSAIVMDAPSGTGKSSLINAGLLPALEPYDFSVISVRFGEHARAMRRAAETPGGNPFEAAVVMAIAEVTGAPPADADLAKAMERLRKEGPGGYVLVLEWPASAARPAVAASRWRTAPGRGGVVVRWRGGGLAARPPRRTPSCTDH